MPRNAQRSIRSAKMHLRWDFAVLGVGSLIFIAGCTHDAGVNSAGETIRPSNANQATTLNAVDDGQAIQNQKLRERLLAAESVVSADGSFSVRYVTIPTPPPMNELFDVELRIDMLGDQPAGEMSLSVDADMPEHGHGMNVVPSVMNLGEHHYRVRNVLFHMPGRWEIYFDLARDGITSRAQDEITLE